MAARTVSSYVALRRGAFSRLYFGAGPARLGGLLAAGLRLGLLGALFLLGFGAALASVAVVFVRHGSYIPAVRELGSRLHADADLLVSVGHDLGTRAACRSSSSNSCTFEM